MKAFAALEVTAGCKAKETGVAIADHAVLLCMAVRRLHNLSALQLHVI